MTGYRARRPRAAAVSAHQGGGEDAPGGTYEAYRAALETGAEYVEFDIRRTADAQLVAFHHASIGTGQAVAGVTYAQLCEAAGYEVPRVPDVMRMIAGKAAGHLDLKEPGSANLIIEQALEILGPGNFVATTEDACAAAIRERFAKVPVALSLGRDLCALPWRRRFSASLDELYPLPRIRACGASWCAIHQRLARAGVLRQCHRHGIKTMVWTVNSDSMITRLLADPRVDVVVTDRPRRAVTLRDQLLAYRGLGRPPGPLSCAGPQAPPGTRTSPWSGSSAKPRPLACSSATFSTEMTSGTCLQMVGRLPTPGSRAMEAGRGYVTR